MGRSQRRKRAKVIFYDLQIVNNNIGKLRKLQDFEKEFEDDYNSRYNPLKSKEYSQSFAEANLPQKNAIQSNREPRGKSSHIRRPSRTKKIKRKEPNKQGLDKPLSSSVDNIRSPNQKELEAKDIKFSLPKTGKNLILFPNAKSQRTRLTDASHTSRARNADLENSDIERYINQEMNASLSESIDLAHKLKESYRQQGDTFRPSRSKKPTKKKKPEYVEEYNVGPKKKPKSKETKRRVSLKDKPLARNKNHQVDFQEKPARKKSQGLEAEFPAFEQESLSDDEMKYRIPIGLDNEPIPPHPKYFNKAEQLIKDQYSSNDPEQKFYNKTYTPVKKVSKHDPNFNKSPQMKNLLQPNPENHQFYTQDKPSRSNSPVNKPNVQKPSKIENNSFQAPVYQNETFKPQKNNQNLSGYLKTIPPVSNPAGNYAKFSSIMTPDTITNSQTLNTLLTRFYMFFPNFKSSDSLLNPALYSKEIKLTHEQAQATYFLISFYQQYTEKLNEALNKNQNSLNFQTSEYQKVKQIKDKYENQVRYERELNVKHESNLAHLRKENRDLLAKLGKLVQEKKLIEANYKNNLEKWKGMVYDENHKTEQKSKNVTLLKAKLEEFRQENLIKANKIRGLEELLSKAKLDLESMRQDNERLEEKSRIQK